MKFNKLRQAILKEIDERYFKATSKAINSEDGLKEELSFYGKQYKGTYEEQLKKFSAYLNKRMWKERKEELNKIQEVEEADKFGLGRNKLIITIEWKTSRMWGNNPRAYTNYGFGGESIGGCGYDKQSTATAQALNSYKPLLKILYARKEKELKNLKKEYTEQNGFKGTTQGHINAEVLGYGSGYGILPTFEGGVGVSSHKRIIEGLGLKMEQITDAKHTDVFIIEK